MLAQYHRIKAENPDAILFFRMGDFYETFFDDAPIVARTLGIALTARDKDAKGDRVPLAGFPHHALDTYLHKMIEAGYKIAICEQIEDPKHAKGVVQRAVVRVVTPGTVTDPKVLEINANRFIVAVCSHQGRFGLAAADVSTGEFLVAETTDRRRFTDELARLEPAELVVPSESASALPDDLLAASIPVTELPAWRFSPETARAALLRHFGTLSLEPFGCEGRHAAVGAAGALMVYLQDTQKTGVEHISAMTTYSLESFMVLDADTVRNLELVRSLRDGSPRATLLAVLDATLTPMGGRRLRQALLQPLLDVAAIRARLGAVADLAARPVLQDDLRGLLKQVLDIERIVGRIELGTANARDFLALANSLASLPSVRELLAPLESSLVATLRDALDPCEDVTALIQRAIHQDPPVTLHDGRLIRDGFNAELDELRDVAAHGKERIAELQQRERKRTGIASLKVGYNAVFGYFIEVTKANLANVPDDYARKQTLANAERFVTPELKEWESRILHAQDRTISLEYEIFLQVRDSVRQETARIQRAAAAIGHLDFLLSLAYGAVKNNYAQPDVDESDVLFVKQGRHPVVEQLVTHEGFVPNDTYLDCGREQLHVITGPNMSGKSTYLRQVALITLMAQMGSFVPAAEARVGVVDRIFTRVGASDSLATGQSTFLVEMNETANILHNATKRSLILLDEIGRGTSTFDGLSIAWAVGEHIVRDVGAKTLFATHYHELVELADHYARVRNYNVAVHEGEDSITFLRKVVEGGTDRSYGIHVARLAGLPEEVLERAMGILAALEQHDISVGNQTAPRPRRKRPRTPPNDAGMQLSLFAPRPPTDPLADELRATLADLEPDRMTPLEALALLQTLRDKARGDADGE
jgi:DNA mismatch repair protein MutS